VQLSDEGCSETESRSLSNGRLKLVKGAHNHERSADPSAHPAYRIAALDSEIYTQVENLSSAGLNNAQILAVIRREKPEVVLISKGRL
jgi:hypothetical protein